MTAPATLATPRRRLGQFSLLWLLTVVIAGCLGAAWFGERLRGQQVEEIVRREQAENRELRFDLGILDDEPNFLSITDKTNVHVRAIPRGELHSRWRIYLPPGTQWDITTTQGERFDDRSVEFIGHAAGTRLKMSGEFTLEARVTRDAEGRAYIQTEQFGSTSRFFIPEPSAAVLQGRGKETHEVLGSVKKVVHDGPGPIELVRLYREVQVEPPPDAADFPAPVAGWGISIQIEERGPRMARLKKELAERGR